MRSHNFDNQSALILAVLSAASISVYLVVSNFTFSLGYPLDDAWIHQTYARNLATGGGWSFVAGQSSGGSTSPLWSTLLASGYFVKLPPFAWTLFLGWLTLWGMALLGSIGYREVFQKYAVSPFWIGALFAMEWHLVWASASGMETSLFALICLLVITWLAAGWERWISLGAVVGLSVWIRPDGVTLLGPALWVLLWSSHDLQKRQGNLVRLIFGFGVLFLPYLFFNRITASAWLPNTFYAKQAEYAIELSAPLWNRLFEQAVLPLVGVGLMLLPGFIAYIWLQFRKRRWALLAAPLWSLGYIALYALRLPVTYQHGRYLIPMMPVFFLWGFAGLVEILRTRSPVLWIRVISKAWQTSAVLVWLVFWALGARAYGRDVAFIQSEMVKTARWVAENTEPGALIAAHDIGALGYFGNRRLLDLAGLVSPEVIPFIRNEALIADYLNKRSANYLMTFPGWYPVLVQQRSQIYITGSQYALAQGGENMAVYRWLTKP